MKKKNTMNIALKVAVVESRRTQRWVSLRTRIPEQRLSDIVQGRAPAATECERKAIAKALRRDVADLFPSADEAVAS